MIPLRIEDSTPEERRQWLTGIPMYQRLRTMWTLQNVSQSRCRTGL